MLCYCLLFRDQEKCFIQARLLTDSVGHCYQYFTQLTALLSLTYLHKVLFHIKLGWGGGAPLLSPTYNPVVKCHMLNIAKVCGGGNIKIQKTFFFQNVWNAAYRQHSNFSNIFRTISFCSTAKLSLPSACINFVLTLNDAAQNFPHKADDAGEMRRFSSSAVRGG